MASVVKNTVTSAQTPFMAKLSYLVQKLLITSQIFGGCCIPTHFFRIPKESFSSSVVNDEVDTQFENVSQTDLVK